MLFAREVWGIADVSSVSPSSEQTDGLWSIQSKNSGILLYADQKVRLEFVASN